MKIAYVPPDEISRVLELKDPVRRAEIFADVCRLNVLYAVAKAKPRTQRIRDACQLYQLDGQSFESGIARAAEVNVEARMTDACREGVRAFLDRSTKPS